jgi:hypothetical protein
MLPAGFHDASGGETFGERMCPLSPASRPSGGARWLEGLGMPRAG